jgi:hypothetical protein
MHLLFNGAQKRDNLLSAIETLKNEYARQAAKRFKLEVKDTTHAPSRAGMITDMHIHGEVKNICAFLAHFQENHIMLSGFTSVPNAKHAAAIEALSHRIRAVADEAEMENPAKLPGAPRKRKKGTKPEPVSLEEMFREGTVNLDDERVRYATSSIALPENSGMFESGLATFGNALGLCLKYPCMIFARRPEKGSGELDLLLLYTTDHAEKVKSMAQKFNLALDWDRKKGDIGSLMAWKTPTEHLTQEQLHTVTMFGKSAAESI